MGPLNILVFVLAAFAAYTVSVSCGQEESAEPGIDNPTVERQADTVVELEAVEFEGRTILRFYNQENRVLCYRDVGYHDLTCVYTGHPSGYPELTGR